MGRYLDSKIYLFFEFLTKLMIINLFWFLTTLLGIGIFTIMPASISVFILMKQLIKGSSFPILSSFWKTFIKEYIRSQKLFLLILLIGGLLYFNVTTYYYKIINENTFISNLGYILTITIILISAISLINLFLVYIYFPNFKTLKALKYAFIFSILFLYRSVLILIIYINIYYLYKYSGSISIFICNWVCSPFIYNPHNSSSEI